MDLVCYPKIFLERPEDRDFITELVALGVPAAEAKLLLYRIWADFAIGGSERRGLGVDDAGQRRAIRSIEEYVGWSGTHGELVATAVSVGFLKRDEGSGVPVLICVGFKECNAGKGRSMQSAGGKATAIVKHAKAAAAAAEERLELWNRTTPRNLEGVPMEKRKRGLVLMLRVCRVLSLKDPGDVVLVDGTLAAILAILDQHSEDAVERTIKWLYGNRTDESIPDQLHAVFAKWNEFTVRAEAEAG